MDISNIETNSFKQVQEQITMKHHIKNIFIPLIIAGVSNATVLLSLMALNIQTDLEIIATLIIINYLIQTLFFPVPILFYSNHTKSLSVSNWFLLSMQVIIFFISYGLLSFYLASTMSMGIALNTSFVYVNSYLLHRTRFGTVLQHFLTWIISIIVLGIADFSIFQLPNQLAALITASINYIAIQTIVLLSNLLSSKQS